MKYLVLVRWMWKNNTAWKTIYKEFDTREGADAYAQEMYNTTAQEINVLTYELVASLN